MIENLSDETLKKVQAVALVALLASGAFALSSFIGCSSAPVKPATEEAGQILASGALDNPAPLTKEQKAMVKQALVASGAAVIKAEAKAEKNAEWAERGKTLYTAAGIGFLTFLLGAFVSYKLFS